MTDDELDGLIKQTSSELESLTQTKEPLPKPMKRRRQALILKQGVLLNIKTAKEKNRQQEEMYNSTLYTMLCTWGEKHPLLVNLLMMKFRGFLY
ncbi:MAG: hypothetical protein HYX96_05005 [Chloroflexi bacterium]|nr:hypothetical protein [Chloroflexota bacterium]